MLDALARPGQRAVAATFGGQINDHAAGGHAFHHRRGHDRRCRAPRYRRRTDHHVHAAQVVGQPALLLSAFLIGQRTRIAAFAGRADAQVEEARAQRLDLLAGFRTHVETFHLRAKAARGGDGLQAGHAGTDYQHLGRTHGSGGGGQHREEARCALGRDQRGLVTGHAGLRAEHVHRLRTGGAWQLLQGEQVQTVVTGQRGQGRVAGRGQQADHAGSGLELLQHRRRRRLHA